MSKGKRICRRHKAEPVKNPLLPVNPTQEQYKLMMKAMDAEIHRQVLEHDEAYWDDITASTIFVLWQEFGFGEKRLKRFFKRFREVHTWLREYYQVEDDESTGWVCDIKLRQAGLNYKDWENE